MKKLYVRCIPLILLLLILFAVAACNEQVRVDDGPVTPAVQKEKDVISKLLIDLQKSFAALNIDKMMTFYAEDYLGSHGENKQEVRELMQTMVDNGAISGKEMSIKNAYIRVSGDSATVAPIKYSAFIGSLKIENTLKKIDGAWKLTQGNPY